MIKNLLSDHWPAWVDIQCQNHFFDILKRIHSLDFAHISIEIVMHTVDITYLVYTESSLCPKYLFAS